MTESKYYTPSIEDLRPSYECEVKGNIYELHHHEGIEWVKTTILVEESFSYSYGGEDYLAMFKDALEKGRLRTPYLTKEQIEGEGWIRVDVAKDTFCKDNFIARYDFENHKLGIIVRDPSKKEPFNQHTGFSGSCPSINEFRIITKLLQI